MALSCCPQAVINQSREEQQSILLHVGAQVGEVEPFSVMFQHSKAKSVKGKKEEKKEETDRRDRQKGNSMSHRFSVRKVGVVCEWSGKKRPASLIILC